MAETFIPTHKDSKVEGLENNIISSEIRRTSNLKSPIVRLEHNQGIITTCKFHPLGELVMSAGYDKKIYLRDVYEENTVPVTMSGHKDTITEAQFSSDGSKVYSSSMDSSVAIWDVATSSIFSFLQGHRSVVNTVQVNRNSNHYICSGSNDGTVRLWDTRESQAVQTFCSGYQVLASCFNDRGDHIISAGVDNCIKIWDIRRNEIVCILVGHEDMISGMALSPCGSMLLSTSLDNTLRVWSMRPFEHGDRLMDSFNAYQSIAEAQLLRCAWSKDGKKISSGSSNYNVHIWDVADHRKVCKIEGHESSVVDVDFHPTEPIIVSGSSCESLFMHELEI